MGTTKTRQKPIHHQQIEAEHQIGRALSLYEGPIRFGQFFLLNNNRSIRTPDSTTPGLRFSPTGEQTPTLEIVWLNSNYLSPENLTLVSTCVVIEQVSARMWPIMLSNKIHVGYLFTVMDNTTLHPYMLKMRRGMGPFALDHATQIRYVDDHLSIVVSPRNMSAAIFANVPMTVRGVTSWRTEC